MTNVDLDRVAFEAVIAGSPGRTAPAGTAGSAVAQAGRRSADRLRSLAVALAFPALLLLLWELSARFGWLPAQILPEPDLVMATFREFIDNGDLVFHTQVSLLRVLQGFGLGAGFGLLLGIAMGLSRQVQELVEPLFLALAQIPPLGWVPLLMLVVGIDEALKIIIIAKAAAIPVTLNTYKGIRNVPRIYREVGEVLTFGPWLTLRKIVLPASVPSIFTGIRYGLTNAWLALVAVELLASSEGLGYLIVWGRQLFQLDLVIMAMILVGVIGFALDWILGLVERRLQRWEVAAS
jgi:sulfonate transport system permease protein